MRLDFKGKKVGAILGCNEVKKYREWLPYAAKAWELNGATPIVLLTGYTEIPDEFLNENWDTILIPELEGVATSYISQIARILYPGALDEYDAIITSDVDTMCLPNKPLFERYINESIEEEKFIVMRYNHPEVFIPWNVAPPKIWRELMGGISTEEQVLSAITNIYKQVGGYDNPEIVSHGKEFWNTDQRILTQQVWQYVSTAEKKYGQVNGVLRIPRDGTVDLAHHMEYWSPYINNDKVKILDKLDYFGAGVKEGKVFMKGSYQWNHEHFKELTLETIDVDRCVAFGTGGASEPPGPECDWILANLWK